MALTAVLLSSSLFRLFGAAALWRAISAVVDQLPISTGVLWVNSRARRQRAALFPGNEHAGSYAHLIWTEALGAQLEKHPFRDAVLDTEVVDRRGCPL
jgi:hypothetical protein